MTDAYYMISREIKFGIVEYIDKDGYWTYDKQLACHYYLPIEDVEKVQSKFEESFIIKGE